MLNAHPYLELLKQKGSICQVRLSTAMQQFWPAALLDTTEGRDTFWQEVNVALAGQSIILITDSEL